MMAFIMADFFRPSFLQSGLAGSHILGALLAIILLSLLALDVLTLYSLRVRLQHNLLQAARQASVHHARPEIIAQAFSQGLAASKVPRHDQWQIQILSPSALAFAVHGRASEQHEGRQGITQGWQALQDEQSPHPSPSIYEANTLHLYLLYAHQAGPLSLMRLLPQLGASMPNSWAFLGSAPIKLRLEIKHPMQSDAIRWDDLADGRVIYAQPPESGAPLPKTQPAEPDYPEPSDSSNLDKGGPLPPWDSTAPAPPPPTESTRPDTSPGSEADTPSTEAPNPACY